MIPKKYYFIKYGKERTVLSSSIGKQEIKLIDEIGKETIKFSEIGHFVSFENQIESSIQKIGFKNSVFVKNIAFVSLPITSTDSSMRTIFESFENIGFADIYLVNEYVALYSQLHNKKSLKDRSLIIDLGASKIAFAIIHNNKIEDNEIIPLGKKRLDHYLAKVELSKLLKDMILEELFRINSKYSYSNQLKNVIVIGGRKRQISINDLILKLFKSVNILEVEKSDNYIIEGLELMSNDMSKFPNCIYERKKI